MPELGSPVGVAVVEADIFFSRQVWVYATGFSSCIRRLGERVSISVSDRSRSRPTDSERAECRRPAQYVQSHELGRNRRVSYPARKAQ